MCAVSMASHYNIIFSNNQNLFLIKFPSNFGGMKGLKETL